MTSKIDFWGPDAEPLHKQLGIPGDEAFMFAYIPVVDGLMDEYPWRDGKREGTLFAWEGLAMDILPEDSKAVKWWLVKNAAREYKLDVVEPIFTCPAADFRVQCLPEVPRPDGTRLAFRMYGRGPWITLPEKEMNESDAT